MLILKKYITPALLIGFLNITSSHCFESCNYKPRVAVIGAGIGGASASHFLSELFDKNVDIDMYESKIIGGRLATIKFGDEEYEAGGAIIHPRNKYMKDFVKFLNLYPRPPVGSTFGIWNGKEFVFEESSWDSVTLVKLLYRYGLDPFHLHRYVGAILDDFERIYELQEKNIGYENVTALIGAMNKEFITLLETSIKDHLTNLGYGSRLIDELVEATLVVNYGQDTNVQSFVACVSVAGAGFDLWAVKGGNKEVPKHLILKNRQVSVIHSAVEKIYRHSVKHATKYEIFYKEKDQDNVTSKFYDIVIIAAPMTTDQEHPIKFEGFENTDLQFSGEYQTTFATFVSGDVNPSYFGLEEEMGVLSCDPIETKISSIGQLSSVEGTKNNITKIYKIFSRQKLNDSILNKMFSQVYEIKEITWKAYPRYSSSSRHDKFKLDDALYYVNAIEWAASAMEMSAIGGRNVAILAYNDHQQKCSSATINKRNVYEETPSHSTEL